MMGKFKDSAKLDTMPGLGGRLYTPADNQVSCMQAEDEEGQAKQ